LTEYEPKPITYFVPQNAAEQKVLFLEDSIRNPEHAYEKLSAIDYEAMQEGIETSTQDILGAIEDDAIAKMVYEQFGDRYSKTARFMEVASRLSLSDDPEEKQRLADEYMSLNVELYGKPEESTYRSLINDSLNELRAKNFSGRAQEIYDELLALMPRTIMELDAERFRPSPETMEWAGRVVEALYGGLLSHIPEGVDSFGEQELKSIFEEIINDEFVDVESGISAAEGWRVVIEKATAVNVKALEKKIVVPDEGRKLSPDVLRGLVVHEIGVHMFRSIMGEHANLGPLRSGLANYYDSEEGLGVVVEQALRGKYRVAGEGHYITTGLAYFDKKDFRDTFEIKWRLGVLSKLKEGVELTDEAVAKERSLAYGAAMRIFRGTDTLPWFKDLAYYNGADSVWRYLEAHRGDDEYLTLLLLGKADPTNNDHKRVLLETRSK